MTSTSRTRWAAIGAAVAVTLGAGGIGITHATTDSGDSPVAAFFPIEPCRLIANAPVGEDTSITLNGWGATGDCTLPNDISGLAANVTAVGATQQTNLRFYAQGTSTPETANLNPSPGAAPTPNAVNITLNTTNGQFEVYNRFGTVSVFIDVMGYYDNHTHDDRYYTEDEVDAALDAAVAFEVEVTDGLFIDQFALVPENTFSIAETVTTERAGRLMVSKYFVGAQTCSSNVAVLYYITVDGVGVRSSAIYDVSGEGQNVRLQGVTENVIPAGDHEIGVGVECFGAATPGSRNTTFVTNSSVIVLPGD